TDRPLHIVSVDMGAMLEQLGASFELEAQKKGMVIHLDEPTTPLMIEADPELLARVFNNLLTNALKYGSDGKNIFINLTQISETEAEITIANDGAKIPTEALGQVFERFYRVEESRSRKTGGTGLGLAIAQGIIDLHHGSINVTSNDKLTSFV
ncbi:GHKL domain-containing protein, partial [Mediterraneibacter glycyrrhizinilyticus]|nr:GHKL domain-containing protein [Mediterraneibacter glycyrrhizinilyticus]